MEAGATKRNRRLFSGGQGGAGGRRSDFRRRQFQDCFAHFLAGLELDDGALGNLHVPFRMVGVAADAGFADFDFKDAKVAQFNGLSCRTDSEMRSRVRCTT